MDVKTTTIGAVVLLCLLVVACGEQNDESVSSASPPSNANDIAVVEGVISPTPESNPGIAPGDPVDSLRSMIEWHPDIIVAVVATGTKQEELDSAAPYTVYELQVSDVIAGDAVAAGEAIPFAIWGGTTSSGFSAPLDGPLQAGATYLFFLTDQRPYGLPGFMGDSRARFRISDDGFVFANGWEALEGPRSVSGASEHATGKGQSLADATRLIRDTIQTQPVGTPPWMANVPTPTPMFARSDQGAETPSSR
jgi:hypothetical protein